jgi:hypothetical protein
MMTRFALLALVVACGGSPPPPPAIPSNQASPEAHSGHEVVASLSRGACLGWCPSYTVQVFRDGTVEYNGESFVKTTGKATWTVTPADIAKIDDLFARNAFMKLGAAYTDYDMTDMPSATVSYAPPGGREKRVEHYYGDDDAPKALVVVEDGLDQIIGIEKYIGTNEERQEMYNSGRSTP